MGFRSKRLLVLLCLFVTSRNFLAAAELEQDRSRCSLPPDRGPCRDTVYRYFYFPEKDDCMLFPYSGCEGNDNRFESKSACLELCSDIYQPDPSATKSPASFLPAPLPAEEPTAKISDSQELVESEVEHPYPELKLYNGTFTFASPSSFIQIGPDDTSNYQIRNRRSVSLEFRTRLPHALLVYHGIKGRPAGINKYELYVMLDQGQLKVKHLFGEHSTTIVVGKGLNRDRWHKVHVEIDPHEEQLTAKVDDDENRMKIDGLKEHRLYGVAQIELESIIFIGGLKPDDTDLEVSYLANPFVGCIRDVSLATTQLLSSQLMPLTDLRSTKFQNIDKDCIDKCWDMRIPCSRDSRCINHYDHVECDCFSATFKGDKCKDTEISVLTLSGYSYVTFTLYEWMDKVHSDMNRISIGFRTRMDDSILFYTVGEMPYHNHIAASIRNHKVYVDINFGDSSSITAHIGNALTDGEWHYLTVEHVGRSLAIKLDQHEQTYDIKGDYYHLYLDPDVYIGGGGPILKNRSGLNSSNNFVGCIQEVYFNEKSILFELQTNKHQARHHGLTAPVFGQCSPQNAVPITVPFAEAGFKILNERQGELHLKFEFLIQEEIFLFQTIAFAEVRTITGEGYWELRVINDEVHFWLYTDKSSAASSRSIKVKYYQRLNQWNSVELQYHFGEFRLKTDRQSQNEPFPEVNQLSQVIVMGTSELKPHTGFMGCIRSINLGGKFVDARTIVGSKDQIGDIALDNCQFVDPCTRPDVCKHEGKCNRHDGSISCECNNSGYIGKHCHFAIFKRTCEELALLGYTESGVYKIDIDGNGPYPPSHVKCLFETDFSGGETKTIVEHNLPNETYVWTPGQESKDFMLELTYREFSPEMLMSLVSQSVQCLQHIKFDCYKAKLGLQQYTWFKSADRSSRNVVSLGDTPTGMCPCAMTKSCAGYDEHCNCDSIDGRYLSDEGFFSKPERLGITQMYFMVPQDLPSDADARITLGPLECVEANTQRYVVTFKTFGSYLEAPGWKSGDLAFSFRTTRSSAILLYQPLYHLQDNSFSVYLANDHELVFRFVLNGGPPQKVTVRSQRALSGGDWQQVWIDYDVHQVRFQINREHQMINLADGQQFGPFEGTMYIAGAPEKDLNDTEVQDGLIGCFRGLVMNGQVLDLYSYMKFHKADIVKDCSPSCDPNPCKNKATCQENWGSFTCLCQNPYAQVGQYCENDINEDGLTFLSQSSYIVRKADSESVDPMKNILRSNFYLNLRTYDEEALVLYANDNLNNFVQIHIEEGEKVILSWNSGNMIQQLSVQPKKPLNRGQSIQVAVLRNATHTTLHVNKYHDSVPTPVNLLTKYSDKPFINPELELFIPPRPFGRVDTYHQLFLAGYDNHALKATGRFNIPGLLGCLRGLKIGDDRILLHQDANSKDVLEGCKMKCDEKPCSNGALCVEDFRTRTHTCDCTYTSYYGKKCDEERGASFGGESAIRQRFEFHAQEINLIEARLGFSSEVYIEQETILLSVRVPTSKYFLLFSLNPAGHLVMREYRHGLGVFSSIVQYQNFVDGSRHSVYFRRDVKNETIMIIDQEEIFVTYNETESLTYLYPGSPRLPDPLKGEVNIGGVIDDSDAELAGYRDFKGCMSNIVVNVNGNEMQTLEEYMGFVKKRADIIIEPKIPEGIKSGACAQFSSLRTKPSANPSSFEPTLPSGSIDWAINGPRKEDLHLRKAEEVLSAGISFDTLTTILAIFLGIIILALMIYVYRLNKRYKRRMLDDDDDDDLYPYRSPVRYQDVKSNGSSQYALYNRQQSPAKMELLSNTMNNKKSGIDSVYSKPAVNPEKSNLTGQKAREIDDENASSDTSSENASRHSSSSNLSNTQVLDDKTLLQPRPLRPRKFRPEKEGHPPETTDPAYIPATAPLLPEDDSDEPSNEPSHQNAHGPVSLTPVVTSSTAPAHQEQKQPSSSVVKLPPVFLSDTVRIIETSPIAIIGGPRYDQMKRSSNSKESIVSLD